MNITTAKPLTMAEVVTITGKDAVMNLYGCKCRILNATAGQVVDVDRIVYDEEHGINWGLRGVSGKPYKYLAYRCEVFD